MKDSEGLAFSVSPIPGQTNSRFLRTVGGEELANIATHGIGLGMSIVGASILIGVAVVRDTPWHVAALTTYALCLVSLYAASTMYHSSRDPGRRRALRVVDHSAIYLLIAGTYTPFTLISLRGRWGWELFAAVWILTILGIGWKIAFAGRFTVISTLLYVLMGWMVVVAIRPLIHAVPLPGILWLVAGGLFYSAGVVFFGWKRIPYSHAVWHVFVMAGSVCHYVAVMRYVLPHAAA